MVENDAESEGNTPDIELQARIAKLESELRWACLAVINLNAPTTGLREMDLMREKSREMLERLDIGDEAGNE